MKKILFGILAILLIFVGLVYFSTWGNETAYDTCIITGKKDLENINFKEYDSIKVKISDLYEAGYIKSFMQGANYRKAWSQEIVVPIVYLDTLRGGLEITKEGGGMQTHSLKLESKSGIIYTLRSVNKDPKELIPEAAETLGLENVIVDGISAQHPFGAILAASLSEMAGLQHTHPKMYFVPKQKALGKYNEKYGNRLFLLEFETESDENWSELDQVKEIVETNKLQELKAEYSKTVAINKNLLVRARLFDLLIGDWDRHAKQWGWILKEEDQKISAIPVAGDRDNAFFNPEGVIPGIITNENVKPLIRPFREKIDHMEGLVYPFDIYFLKGTPKQIFLDEAKFLQQRLNDENIKSAFEVWPGSIRKIDEEQISQKLISRRNDLLIYAEDFYRIIDESPYLTEALKGSEDLELPKELISCFECLEKTADQ